MKHIYDNQNGNHKSSEERFTERFREVAQNYEPVFEPADWSAMQSKLAAHNEKNRRTVVFRRLAIFASMSAAAVILLFGGYQFLDNSSTTISNKGIAFQENKIDSNTESPNSNSISNSITIEKTTTQNDKTQNLAATLDNNYLGNNSEKNTKNFTKTKSYSDSESQIQKNNQTNQFAFNSSIDNSKGIREELNTTNSLLTNNETIQSTKSNKMLSVSNIKQANFDLFANVKPKELAVPELKIDETLLALANQTTNQNEEVIRKNPVVSAIGKWRLGAALMAMTNIYKSNDKQRMNYTNGYGLMADYQIAKRFNISAGAVYTQKRIDMEEPLSIPTNINDFAPNTREDAWVKKNNTQINWQLLDLPIHLRYNAIQTDRNKWFVSTGTSNYFFLKENYESDYTVSYQDIYDPRLTRTQEVVKQRETQSALQLFATINVSAGIETSLGKHLTLQVEPYWRFPVRSLGSEGVFVQTGGLLTRINFAL